MLMGKMMSKNFLQEHCSCVDTIMIINIIIVIIIIIVVAVIIIIIFIIRNLFTVGKKDV